MNLLKVSLFLLVLSPILYAKTFTSQYCQFELPPSWECILEGSEWVCQHTGENQKREAIIILAAKVRGEKDSLEHYQAHLKKAKSFQLPGGRSQVSEPKFVKLKKINNKQWIDSLHLASEVPGFFTRYLVTVEKKLGVAVTFSVSKDHYDVYQGLFDKIIATLKVFQPDSLNEKNFKIVKSKSEDLLSGSIHVPETPDNLNVNSGQKKKIKTAGGDDDILIYGGIVILALFIFLKMRKK